MNRQKTPSFKRLQTVAMSAVFAAMSVALGACSDKTKPADPPQADAQPTAPVSPATQSTPEATAAGYAAQAPAGTAATPASGGRKVAVSAQASSPIGLTVRVKQIEMTADATILTVSISLGGDKTIFTSLVDTETYLLDDAGNKLLPKLPGDNRFLRVRKGETLEGELVFMGALPATARQVEWVINEGNTPDNTSGPGLKLSLPISAA